jgi:8-oxo-dGTP pyrophosphatase MutT (NUDIX family)
MVNAARFPFLFAPLNWGVPITGQFELRRKLPPADLIANVTIVPFVGEKCVVIQVSNHHWEVPGGTLEVSETYFDAACRELLEEAGIRLLSFHPFGVWDCFSQMEQPYRPHLPHPHFYRLAGYGEVELVGEPLNPAAGEQVTKVEIVTLEEAANRFTSIGRGDLADLYKLAALLRKERHANS